MKSAIVTGATGFVGSHLSRHLAGTGWQVHAIVRTGSDTTTLNSLSNTSVHVFDGSTASIAPVLEATESAVLFHLASLFIAEHQHEHVRALIDSNLAFGIELVDALTERGLRSMVNTGTVWQHYEGASYNPVNLYAATKQAFEDLLAWYVDARELRVVTLELSDTYGPGDHRPKLMKTLREMSPDGSPLDMSPGEQVIELLHVDDAVSAFPIAAERLLRTPDACHERFTLTSGEPLSLRQLIEAVERARGQTIPVRWGARPYRARELMAPPGGQRLPGWAPAIDLASGLHGYFEGAA